MTYHVVCHDCKYEHVVDYLVEADGRKGYHAASTNHDVEFARVDDD